MSERPDSAVLPRRGPAGTALHGRWLRPLAQLARRCRMGGQAEELQAAVVPVIAVPEPTAAPVDSTGQPPQRP